MNLNMDFYLKKLELNLVVKKFVYHIILVV